MQYKKFSQKKEKSETVGIVHFRKKFIDQQIVIQQSITNFVLNPKGNETFTETKEVGNLRLIKEVLFSYKACN